jgi:hypothetical protein
MRIKVEVGNEKAQVYLVKDPSLIIESGPSANPRVAASSGASRKHAQIIVDEGKMYVIDMGSTNGTYINEIRITPGIRVEVPFILPVKTSVTSVTTKMPLKNRAKKKNTKRSSDSSRRHLTESEVPSMITLENALSEVKCVTSLEKRICEILPGSEVAPVGAVESIGQVIIVLPEGPCFEKSFELDQAQRTKISMLHLLRDLPNFSWNQLDENLFLSFIETTKDKIPSLLQ